MRLQTMRRWTVGGVLGICLVTAGVKVLSPSPVRAQEQEADKTEELTRKAKIKVLPVYPEVARRMNIAGTVRLAVIVAPNGTVRSSKAIGGHPVLVNAAMDAVKQWKFEPGSNDTSGIVEFKFKP